MMSVSWWVKVLSKLCCVSVSVFIVLMVMISMLME